MSKTFGVVVQSRTYEDAKSGQKKAVIEVLIQNEQGNCGVVRSFSVDPQGTYSKSLPVGSIAQCEIELVQSGVNAYTNLVSAQPTDKKAALTFK